MPQKMRRNHQMKGTSGCRRWVRPQGSLELKQGEIHLWRADLDRHMDSLPVLEQTLDAGEREKAGEFHSQADRNRFILARAILRTILAKYLNTQPGQLTFCYGPQGKPELAGGSVRFNVSHSDGLALYAISGVHDVGVDVERVRPGVEEDVAGWLFPLRAIRFLEALPQPARRHAFFQGWARMEAYQKARGEGLALSFENFETFLHQRDLVLFGPREDLGEAAQWWLHGFFPRRGYVAALAARGHKCRLRYWRWHASN